MVDELMNALKYMKKKEKSSYGKLEELGEFKKMMIEFRDLASIYIDELNKTMNSMMGIKEN